MKHTEMTIADAERFIESYCIDPPPAGAAERLRAAAAAGLDMDTERNQDAIDNVIYGPQVDTEYTHVIEERGNGLPSVGDEVIVHDDSGWHEIRRIESISRIITEQWRANRVYVTLEDAEREYDDLTEAEQEEAYEGLHHADPLDDDEVSE